MAKTDITLTREDADYIQTTLGKARQAVRMLNPTLASQLLACTKALDAMLAEEEEPTEEPETDISNESGQTLPAADVAGSEPGETKEPTETKSESKSD